MSNSIQKKTEPCPIPESMKKWMDGVAAGKHYCKWCCYCESFCQTTKTRCQCNIYNYTDKVWALHPKMCDKCYSPPSSRFCWLDEKTIAEWERNVHNNCKACIKASGQL